MRTGLHPEFGVSADDGGGLEQVITTTRLVPEALPPWLFEGAGAAVWVAPPSGGLSKPFSAGAGPPGPWNWVRRRRAGPESQGGFSALWKRERDSGGGPGRHLVQVLEAGGEWGLPAAGPPPFPGAGDPTLFSQLWPGGSSASTGRSCPESLGLQAWRGLSRLLRSVWQMARKGPSSSFSFIFSDRVR